jgi:polyvinyl alcohol dehydrogenase (cytochrome)
LFGNPAACPDPKGPDFDFAQGASLFTATVPDGNKSKKIDLVGAGQKSGDYWALNPDTGAIVWTHNVGPGSSLGGLEWGSAVDGTRVYAALANLFNTSYVLQPSGVLVFGGGGWAALDAGTGKPVWQVADANGGMGLGPVTGANGVIFACSMPPVVQTFPFGLVDASKPNLFAFDAASGHTLWSYSVGASCNDGPAIADGDVYWGTGYGNLGPTLGTSNSKLYAFTVN